MKLRSIHFTSILAGHPRPSWSSFKNKKHRKRFILYYSILLIPCGYCYEEYDLPSELDKYGSADIYQETKKITELIHICSGANGPVPALLRARYYTFHNIVHNMNSPYKVRLTSSK